MKVQDLYVEDLEYVIDAIKAYEGYLEASTSFVDHVVKPTYKLGGLNRARLVLERLTGLLDGDEIIDDLTTRIARSAERHEHERRQTWT